MLKQLLYADSTAWKLYSQLQKCFFNLLSLKTKIFLIQRSSECKEVDLLKQIYPSVKLSDYFNWNFTSTFLFYSEVMLPLYERDDQRTSSCTLTASLPCHKHKIIMKLKADQLNGWCSCNMIVLARKAWKQKIFIQTSLDPHPSLTSNDYEK